MTAIVENIIEKIHSRAVKSLCKKYNIARLALFGSALRDDFGPKSDIDLLVEFVKDKTPGMFGMANLELELSKLLKRKVDLRTPAELSQYFRADVMNQAQVQF